MQNIAIAVVDTRKERLQRVIVASSDWIELVIMTARTTNGQSEERAAGTDNDLVQSVLSGLPLRYDVYAIDRPSGDQLGVMFS